MTKHHKPNWEQAQELVQDILKQARKKGVDAAEASATLESGLSTTVRLGTVETIEFTRDQSMGITVYKGKRKGNASTSDLRPQAIADAIQAACDIADYTEEDPCSGLADQHRMATQILDLDLYHPSVITPEQAIEWAKGCEDSARAHDPRITNSNGASFSSSEIYSVYGNTHGFLGSVPSSFHSLSCSVIGQEGTSMQGDYEYTIARDCNDLAAQQSVGKRSAAKAIARLGARKIATCQVPVLFRSDIARSLLDHFIAAISGRNLYRRASFLLDTLGKPIFPSFVNIQERPHLLKAMGSAPFDSEGVATQQQYFVKDGVLQSYVLGSYSARKLGMESTGNSGGVHNVSIEHQDQSWQSNSNSNPKLGLNQSKSVSPNQNLKPQSAAEQDQNLKSMLKKLDRGLFVTELMGHGINLTTGDYSRGASGFWVEKGEIQYPVEEITVAANLRDLFLNLVAIGEDLDRRGNIITGSLLFEEMTLAGH